MKKKLRQSEDRFRRIFDSSHDAIFIIHPPSGRILDVNPRACSLLGYTHEELTALPISAIHRDEMTKLKRFAESVYEAGQGRTAELSCRRKSGERIPAEMSASVIDVDGESCLIALVRDITHRKRVAAAQEEDNERLRLLVEERTGQWTRAEHRQQTLLRINNATIVNRDRGALFTSVVETLQDVIPFDRSSLILLDPRTDTLRFYGLFGFAASDRSIAIGTEFPREGSHLQELLDQKQPLIRHDLTRGARTEIEDRLLDAGVQSYIAAPLTAASGVLGSLNVGSLTPDRFLRDDAEFLMEAAKQVALAMENMLAFEEIARLKAQVERENVYLQEEIKTEKNFAEIVGQSSAIKRVLKDIETVAPTDASVLILGETGTGKELIARAVHNLGPRKDKALVKVNCAALPAGLIESELFGHERGAFTGALMRKIGRFELADGGTVFLDEIGDLPLELQAKLLRVLQEGEFERLGSLETIRVDVRVIAATHHDLEKAIEQGRFRADLYYRLHVFPIRLPPLRERKGDLSLLVNYFTAIYATRMGKQIRSVSQKAMDALTAYPWPGNVRELANVIERAVIISPGPRLELGDWLPKPESAPADRRIRTLAEIEREHILQVLELTGWRVSGERGAAKRLGLKPTTLEARMKKHGIKRRQ